MAMFVCLAIFLFQKGYSESKKFDGTDEVDKEPSPDKKDAPWSVKKGGFILSIYKYSLIISLVKDENEQNLFKGLPIVSASSYLSSLRFWFESFQNWQSEFLSVFAIVVLPIFLRQKGSPHSKPVDAAYAETEES